MLRCAVFYMKALHLQCIINHVAAGITRHFALAIGHRSARQLFRIAHPDCRSLGYDCGQQT
jgi:hypothetical protein